MSFGNSIVISVDGVVIENESIDLITRALGCGSQHGRGLLLEQIDIG